MKERFNKCFAILAISLTTMVMVASPVQAQTFYGTVVGIITDSTSAVIPGASVTLTNIGTNEKRTAETDASGNYRFVNLAPANYRLEVEMAGFKHLTREPIAVQVESTVRIDAALEVGAVTETVEVSSEAPLLQTETGSLSQVVEGKQVQEMPLNGRNVINLITLTPAWSPKPPVWEGRSKTARLGVAPMELVGAIIRWVGASLARTPCSWMGPLSMC